MIKRGLLILFTAFLTTLIVWRYSQVDAQTIGKYVTATKEASTEGPLKLEVLISVVEVPTTIIFRATNITDKDIEIQYFGREYDNQVNYLLEISPSGKKSINITSNNTPLVKIKPGESKEWKHLVGRGSMYTEEKGTYRLYWVVNKQRSQEILLSMYPIPLTSRPATQPATAPAKSNQ